MKLVEIMLTDSEAKQIKWLLGEYYGVKEELPRLAERAIREVAAKAAVDIIYDSKQGREDCENLGSGL